MYLDGLYREKLIEPDVTFSPFGKRSLDNVNVIYLSEDNAFESCTAILDGRPTFILKKVRDQLLIPDNISEEARQKAMRVATAIQAMCFLSWLQDNPTKTAQEFPKFEASHPVAARAIRTVAAQCKIEEIATNEGACKAIFNNILGYTFPPFLGHRPETDYGEMTESLRDALHSSSPPVVSPRKQPTIEEDDLERLSESHDDYSFTGRRPRPKRSDIIDIYPGTSKKAKDRKKPKTLHEINMEIIERNKARAEKASSKKRSHSGLGSIVQSVIDSRDQQAD